MTMKQAFEDAMSSVERDIPVMRNEVAIYKNLIRERKHPLDLVRELLSNAGAREVTSGHIDISYTKDREGHIFEIQDDGCGMDYTGHQAMPGRLDRFLGLGLSAIAGLTSDEFSWKGLGSKLAYQSRKIEIQTRHAGNPEYNVTVNEPWDSLERGLVPNPRLSYYPESTREPGTRIRVIGHPPHRQDRPFDANEIRSYLLHRTFAGYTRERPNPPEIVLSVLGAQEVLPFGFPEFHGIGWPRGLVFDRERQRLIVSIAKSFPGAGLVHLKGFLVWDGEKQGLDKNGLNTGLILSARGIPYFELDMEEYGARSIMRGYPGKGNTCLVVECDAMSAEMNIARSDLVDSAATMAFRDAVRRLLEELERHTEYLDGFRSVPTARKRQESATHLGDQKRAIESDEQNWVVFQRGEDAPKVLMREPRNESEVNALIWKLEALGGLPFHTFQSLAYVGAHRGPDLIANFQEDRESEPLRAAVFEIELNFYGYKAHGHTPSQYPKVICWDAPTSGRKDRLNPTQNKYKFTVTKDESQIHVFVLRQMDGIRVVPKRELAGFGVTL